MDKMSQSYKNDGALNSKCVQLLHLSLGIWRHSLWANCSSCLRCLFITACFSSFHNCSIGFRSGLTEGPLRTVQYCVLAILCFFSRVLGHDPVGRPVTCDCDQASWYWAAHFTPECLESVMIWWHPGLHRFKTPCARCSTAAPEHNWTFTFHNKYSLLFLCMLQCLLMWI